MKVVDGDRIWRKSGTEFDGATGVDYEITDKYVLICSTEADAFEIMLASDGSRILRKTGIDYDGCIEAKFSPNGEFIGIAVSGADAVEVIS